MWKVFCRLLSLIGLILGSCANNSSEIVGDAKEIDLSNIEQMCLSDVFSELEVVHMDAGVKSMVPNANYVQPCDDKYVFIDNQRKVYVFDKKGHFISSSKSVYGNGHGEFVISMGGSYNPYSNNIEIITPTDLMFYDINFKYIKSVPLPTEYQKTSNNNKPLFFDEIYDLSEHLHVLITPKDNLSQAVNTLFIFDSEKQEIVKTINYDKDVMGKFLNQAFSFQNYADDEIIFIPPCYSKNVYKFDKDNLELRRFISFNYGDEFYTEEDLKPIQKEANPVKIDEYLSKNYKRSPIRISYDKGKYFILVDSKEMITDAYLLIVDTKMNTAKRLPLGNENDEFQFYPHSCVYDNILYIAVEAEGADVLMNAFPGKVTEINKYNADSTMNDNIAVLKYHLK